MSGQFHASATLPPEERGPLPSEEQARWAPEPVSTFWKRQKSLSPNTNQNTIPWPSSPQPTHHTKLDTQIPPYKKP